MALGVAVRSALELLAAEDGLVVAVDDLQWLDASSDGRPRLRAAASRRRRARRLDAPARRGRRTDRGRGGARRGPDRARPRRAAQRRRDPPRPQRPARAAGAAPDAPPAARGRGREPDVRPRARAGARRRGRDARPDAAAARARAAGGARLGEARRVHGGATHEALVLVSAESRLTPAQLGEAGVDEDALAPALEERVLELGEGTVRFAHPLLASVLYQGLSADERREAHARLAGLVDDPLARARHLALSADAVDAGSRRDARGRRGRGRRPGCADRRRRARRVRAPPDAAGRRRGPRPPHGRDCARAFRGRSGRPRARTCGRPARARRAGDGAGRGARPRGRGTTSSSRRCCRCARRCANLERRSCSRRRSISASACSCGSPTGSRPPRSTPARPWSSPRAPATPPSARPRWAASRSSASTPASRVRSSSPSRRTRSPPATRRRRPIPRFALGHVLVWSCELERARALLAGELAEWSERDERLAASALWYLAIVELRAGHLVLAGEYAERARELEPPVRARGGRDPAGPVPAHARRRPSGRPRPCARAGRR